MSEYSVEFLINFSQKCSSAISVESIVYCMGRGGIGVCFVLFNRKVAGSNLPQATA